MGLGFLDCSKDFCCRKVDSRLRGNDDSRTEIYVETCDLPPSPVRRERVGERVALWAAQFDFAYSHEATPILTVPRQTGEETKLQLQQRVEWALPTKLGVCSFEG